MRIAIHMITFSVDQDVSGILAEDIAADAQDAIDVACCEMTAALREKYPTLKILVESKL